jgi:hypothetical protein
MLLGTKRSEAEETAMGRHGSRRPSINTSADAVLRRLEHDFTTEPDGVRDLVRAHLRPLAVVAMLGGATLATTAILAPMVVAVLGGLVVATGMTMVMLVEDDDRVTGVERTRRWCRRTIRRVVRRPRRRALTPLGCRVAPWLFPDPRKQRP